ncbi:hypothetical protein JXL21_00380 [Candidatus Bathyarchaeota archaeon]|nr:hypothetical protein [Candidatus Bathyarchaeota archaeon]
MTVETGWGEKRRMYARFLLSFLFIGLVMKILGEFTHEAGHALMVLALGGSVKGVFISFEWPFSLSHTTWVLDGPTGGQIALIAVAGILSDTLLTVLGQSLLLRRSISHPLATVSVFWLSFWTYLNSMVYLVVGSVHPFGDILDLIEEVPVPRLLIGALGVTLLAAYTYSLSLILRGIFSQLLEPERASEMVSMFWILLHMFFVLTTVMRYGLPMPPEIGVASIVLIFTLSYISGRGLIFLVSRLGTGERLELIGSPELKPRESDAEDDRGIREKYGYAVILLVAAVSLLATGVMVNQYLSTYNLIMKTEVAVEATGFQRGQGAVLYVNVSVTNPTPETLTVKRVEFDVKLNGKYMTQMTLNQIPPVAPGETVFFGETVALPADRGFTIDEAVRDDSWDWTVAGVGYVDTLFGETLLRFRCASTVARVTR